MEKEKLIWKYISSHTSDWSIQQREIMICMIEQELYERASKWLIMNSPWLRLSLFIGLNCSLSKKEVQEIINQNYDIKY